MTYEPQVGQDYIIDYYAIANIPSDASTDEVKQAIRGRQKQYHPDLLEGRAPEFIARGQRMAQLLNEAQVILLDETKRAEYDEIKGAWSGPVSTDGNPVITTTAYRQMSMAMKSPEEIEAGFDKDRIMIIAMTKHIPAQQAVLQRLLESADPEDASDLREAYDAALYAEDQVLAIEEANRSELLGIASDAQYYAGLGHADQKQESITAARAMMIETYEKQALGNVSVRLALLAGTTSSPEPGHALVTSEGLPNYFESQAAKIADIAERREALLMKRLNVFEPVYPIPEIQTSGMPQLAVGVAVNSEDAAATWLGFTIDIDKRHIENVDVPESVESLLRAGDYGKVYEQGFNILTFALKDQIDPATLVDEACNKHVQKYFPDTFR